ncbi:hypothetical protein HGRIS_009438 [Hohenbuehelia grisea]|uniref:DH domain-containing protein n=1 Tax=Hohenbuehelia grisea TaxID=104357 RepID=A0ABR3J164_9AGAR
MAIPAPRPSLSPLTAIFAHRPSRRTRSDASNSQVSQSLVSPSAVAGPSRTALVAPCPLSPIAASPECPPVICASPEPLSLDSDLEREEPEEDDHFTTPHKRATNIQRDSRRSCIPPTWISIPPTPPPTLVRRSVTCHTRRPTALVSSSTTFPVVPSSHPQTPTHALRRRASIAVMSPIPQPSSRTRESETFGMHSHWRRDPGQRPSSPLRSMILSPSDDVELTPRKRPRPLFQIVGDTDTEDGPPTVESSTKDVHPVRHHERHKDDTRRFYALLELLTTEIGYLMDLRALVEIYLRQLSLLACRPIGRSHSSFSAISRVGSFTHLGQAAQPAASSTLHGPRLDQPPPRPVFSEKDIQVLTRNAEGLLELHERFVAELRLALEPYGLAAALSLARDAERHYADSELVDSLAVHIDDAVTVVCAKFATESSRFNSYQTFCASHPEALDLLRRTQHQYPLEWHGFEHKCSAMIRDSLEAVGQIESPVNPESPPEGRTIFAQPSPPNRTRTTSMTSLDGAVRTLRSKTGLRSKESVVFPTDGDSRREPSRPPRRLALMDYMIKPVQRICKYPLLLDQLKVGKHLVDSTATSGTASASPAPPARKPDVQVVVESAAQAMRHVASSVDEARYQQDVAIQSALIAARISSSHAVADSVNGQTGQTLTPAFLASLGTCLFAGALDVVHYQSGKALGSRGKIRTKYLGAFLYSGGYFILAKIGKGKVYDPRHWLSLQDFDVIDLCEEEALLPSSFRFLTNGHQFEVSASCQVEKAAWLAAIRDALKITPNWTNEPVSSIHCDGKGEIVPSTLEGGPFEAINALPTIQSIPELANSNGDADDSDAQPSVQSSPVTLAMVSPISKSEPPSRRSSATSVRSLFTPLSSDPGHLVISRSTSAARATVDAGLQDVISQSCVAARARASASEEDLFLAPTITRRPSAVLLAQPPVAYSSGIGIGMGSPFASGFNGGGATARERVLRNETERVFRRRSFLDGSDTFTRRTKSFAGRKQSKKLSAIATFDLESADLAPPLSLRGRSSGGTTDSAPSTASVSAPQTPISREDSESRHFGKAQHLGLVHNMMGFFSSSRPASPITTPNSEPDHLPPHSSTQPRTPASAPASDDDHRTFKTITPAMLKRWAQGHRRSRSASDTAQHAAAAAAAAALLRSQLAESRSRQGKQQQRKLASLLGEPFLMDEPESELPEFEVGMLATHAAKRAVVQVTPVSPTSYAPDLPPVSVRHKKISLLQRFKSIEVG